MINFYKQWLDLLPSDPLQVGTVTAVNGEFCAVELPGGGVIQARGAAAVSDRVFVQGGVIESVAQALPVVNIEI